MPENNVLAWSNQDTNPKLILKLIIISIFLILCEGQTSCTTS